MRWSRRWGRSPWHWITWLDTGDIIHVGTINVYTNIILVNCKYIGLGIINAEGYRYKVYAIIAKAIKMAGNSNASSHVSSLSAMSLLPPSYFVAKKRVDKSLDEEKDDQQHLEEIRKLKEENIKLRSGYGRVSMGICTYVCRCITTMQGSCTSIA